MKIRAFITSLLIAGVASGCATAQTTTPAPTPPAANATTQTPPPPCQAAIYRAFDFWLGEWSVTAGGQFAGDNKISTQENGCLLLEEWTSASGTTGQSYNFYDPASSKWRQLWISGGAVIDYSGGLDDDGAMALEGTIAYRNGLTAPFKGTWTLLDDGTVRQHFQQYDGEQEVWNDWFIGIYTKKDAAP